MLLKAMAKNTILVIDDERELVELVAYNLQKDGFPANPALLRSRVRIDRNLGLLQHAEVRSARSEEKRETAPHKVGFESRTFSD
jgi:hypothetical protein